MKFLEKTSDKIIRLLREEKFDELFYFCKEKLYDNQDNLEALFTLPSAARTLAQHKEAAHYYQQYLERHNDVFPLFFTTYASILLKCGRTEDAFKCYDLAISMSSGDNTLLFDKALALQGIGLHKDAIDLFKRILKKHPTQVSTINALVYSLLAEKKFEEVKEYNEKALKINPSDPEALAQKQELQKVFGQNF